MYFLEVEVIIAIVWHDVSFHLLFLLVSQKLHEFERLTSLSRVMVKDEFPLVIGEHEAVRILRGPLSSVSLHLKELSVFTVKGRFHSVQFYIDINLFLLGMELSKVDLLVYFDTAFPVLLTFRLHLHYNLSIVIVVFLQSREDALFFQRHFLVE